MSVPDAIAESEGGAHYATSETAMHYFADYEVHVGASLHRWGSVTLAYDVAEASGFDADTLVRQLRAKAAARCGVDACDVRVRNICRL